MQKTSKLYNNDIKASDVDALNVRHEGVWNLCCNRKKKENKDFSNWCALDKMLKPFSDSLCASDVNEAVTMCFCDSFLFSHFLSGTSNERDCNEQIQRHAKIAIYIYIFTHTSIYIYSHVFLCKRSKFVRNSYYWMYYIGIYCLANFIIIETWHDNN